MTYDWSESRMGDREFDSTICQITLRSLPDYFTTVPISCLSATLAKLTAWHASFMATAAFALTWKCATASTLHNLENFFLSATV